ncbi:MAG: hypothetical protein HGA97_07025 [Chlorobiaceae bacterium]|nr:hypothetical protein [Chlorobiaceae bacterium]
MREKEPGRFRAGFREAEMVEATLEYADLRSASNHARFDEATVFREMVLANGKRASKVWAEAHCCLLH